MTPEELKKRYVAYDHSLVCKRFNEFRATDPLTPEGWVNRARVRAWVLYCDARDALRDGTTFELVHGYPMPEFSH